MTSTVAAAIIHLGIVTAFRLFGVSGIPLGAAEVFLAAGLGLVAVNLARAGHHHALITLLFAAVAAAFLVVSALHEFHLLEGRTARMLTDLLLIGCLGSGSAGYLLGVARRLR